MNEEMQINKDENLKGIKSIKLGKHTALVIVLALFALFIVFLVVKKLTKKEVIDFTAVPAVNVTHVHKGKVEKEISLMGTVLPTDTYYVAAKVGGDIKTIYVKNGDYVNKGDPICDIDASKEIEAAFIQYDAARKSYNRMYQLYKAGDISRQDFETVKAQYDAAKLSYDTKVEYSTPVAVGDGYVENVDMVLNNSIKAEKVLCYITSDEAMEINYGVTERVLDGIKLGDKVKVEKAGKIYDGKISDIGNLINQQTGLFNVKAVITSPNTFASGIMAKVTFVYDRRKNVDVLSNEMVYYEGGNAFVYTVNAENNIVKKYIEVGIEDEHRSEIISGITKSDKIVSTWNKDLAEGTFVNVVKEITLDDEIDIEETDNSGLETIGISTMSEIDVESIATMSEIGIENISTASEIAEDK